MGGLRECRCMGPVALAHLTVCTCRVTHGLPPGRSEQGCDLQCLAGLEACIASPDKGEMSEGLSFVWWHRDET